MSHDEHPADAVLTQELRDSLSDLAVPGRPPLAAITRRGRGYQRRRLAGLGITSAAVGIALALGLTVVFGAARPRITGTAQTAAFSLTSYTNGTVELRLSQLFDPAALQRALAHHGIPALVKTGTYCSSHPATPGLFRLGVSPAPTRTPHRALPGPNGQGILQLMNIPVKPSQLAPMVDPVSVVFNPAAIPSGTELFIGFYSPRYEIFMDLIYTKSHTCRQAQRPPFAP